MMRPASARSKVLVVGSMSLDETEFTNRGLTVERVELTALKPALFSQARGILIADASDGYGIAAAFFRRHFGDACDCGLTTLIHTDGRTSAEAIKLRDLALEPFNFSPKEINGQLKMLVGGSLASLAHTLYEHKPGPELGSPSILVHSPEKRVSRHTRQLLARAFWDCEAITVEQLSGGQTAAGAFRVHAALKWTSIPPQPMPFFVKIGERGNILSERENYRNWVDPFIPFYLRPNVCDQRCVFTLSTGVLVCNFVDGAVGLRDALRSGQADGAIFSLFEVTLRGIRIQSLRSLPEKGAIESFLRQRVRAACIAKDFPDRIALAHRLRASVRPPEAIEAALIAHASGLAARWGIYHGDLHCGNVMIRQREAIVIDFGSMPRIGDIGRIDFGPLSADPAFLEVSLAFGTDRLDSPDQFDEWRAFIDETFLSRPTMEPPRPSLDHFHFVWLQAAIREIRHVVKCCGISDEEAMIVLCGCLLRFGRLSMPDLPTKKLRELSEKKRAYALVVADRMMEKLCSDG